MEALAESHMLDARIERDETGSTPSHHVTGAAGITKAKRTGFRNPWPSWHVPTRKETLDALEWGEDNDPCIELAVSSLAPTKGTGTTQDRANQAAQLLRVVEPDFDFDSASQNAKVTWLGHAGMLVQVPSLKDGATARPVRCLFDPIFSMRCSPTQAAGPIRRFPAPCKVESLPPIDVLLMSHNHYDHLDYNTVMGVWQKNQAWIRFVVPLGNKQWFVECGISPDRVIELDWWESVSLSHPGTSTHSLKITCTPAQHNSGRSGFDGNAALWSSWYLEQTVHSKPYRTFYAGDSGYQFHTSPNWPPPPSSIDKKASELEDEEEVYPPCPVFQEIADRLGAPHLLILPISVGASFSFIRSYVPLPDSISPFPRHRPGLTAADHMPPWDAVRVLRLMESKKDADQPPPVAIAMHWGTFVTEPVEVLKTLGALESACQQQGVQFARSLPEGESGASPSVSSASFLAINHGQSVTMKKFD